MRISRFLPKQAPDLGVAQMRPGFRETPGPEASAAGAVSLAEGVLSFILMSRRSICA